MMRRRFRIASWYLYDDYMNNRTNTVELRTSYYRQYCESGGKLCELHFDQNIEKYVPLNFSAKSSSKWNWIRIWWVTLLPNIITIWEISGVNPPDNSEVSSSTDFSMSENQHSSPLNTPQNELETQWELWTHTQVHSACEDCTPTMSHYIWNQSAFQKSWSNFNQNHHGTFLQVNSILALKKFNLPQKLRHIRRNVHLCRECHAKAVIRPKRHHTKLV
jgi:hypothetical protein